MSTLSINFKINTTGTSYSIKNKNDEVPLVIQNFTIFLQNLQSGVTMRKLDILESYDRPEIKEILLKKCDEDKKILSQIFDNFSIEGVMEDGKKFTFSHSEPGYKESLIFHE